MLLHCKVCNRDREDFHFTLRSRKRPDKGKRLYCKSCAVTALRRKRHLNPEKYHDHHLREKHGVAIDLYLKLFEKQKGLCAICNKPPTKRFRVLHLDHDHLTGNIRGLLCQKCNCGLGYFGDDPDLIQKALKYLQRSNK